MKLNKDNCRLSFYNDWEGTAHLEAMTRDSSFHKARVIEVPKVWRENGKQYKVDFVAIMGLEDVDFIVKAPRGCSVCCGCASKIEYYD